MLNTTFPPWPSYTAEEADAVREVLISNKVNYWTGSEIRRFECDFAGYTHSRFAIALANGTVALDLALIALGVGPGDEVIVTPRTFIASISSVISAKAVPVFADVDINTQNITADTISKVITKKTKAIIVVHLAGMPADMDPIMLLAERHSLKIIEDCAQAQGAIYKDKPVGSIGHIGAWSFCQDKIITTGGEGGMVTTNDKGLWSAMWSYKDHGKSFDAVYNQKHSPGFRWLHYSFGTNWRMTELQAVIGRIQTARMSQWHKRRLHNARQIWDACSRIEWLRVPSIRTDIEHAAYKAYVFVRPEKLPKGWDREVVIARLLEQGVPTYSGSCSEVYLEKAFDNTNYRPANRLPVAKELGETSLMFLVHPTLEQRHLNLYVSAVRAVDAMVQAELQEEANKMMRPERNTWRQPHSTNP